MSVLVHSWHHHLVPSQSGDRGVLSLLCAVRAVRSDAAIALYADHCERQLTFLSACQGAEARVGEAIAVWKRSAKCLMT